MLWLMKTEQHKWNFFYFRFSPSRGGQKRFPCKVFFVWRDDDVDKKVKQRRLNSIKANCLRPSSIKVFPFGRSLVGRSNGGSVLSLDQWMKWIIFVIFSLQMQKRPFHQRHPHRERLCESKSPRNSWQQSLLQVFFFLSFNFWGIFRLTFLLFGEHNGIIYFLQEKKNLFWFFAQSRKSAREGVGKCWGTESRPTSELPDTFSRSRSLAALYRLISWVKPRKATRGAVTREAALLITHISQSGE